MKNNKGFIATSLILTFFLLFCALLLNTIRNYNFNQNLIDKLDDIKFEQTKITKLTNYIENQYNVNASSNGLEKDTTPDLNIRYVGANPKNYVKFNNELWRIIGIFNGNVKLVRDDILTTYSFDNKTTAQGIETDRGTNDWANSYLREFLNDYYYEGKTITCHSEASGATTATNATITCPDINKINDSAKSMIQKAMWNLGGFVYRTIPVNELYTKEKGTEVYNGHATTSTDYIGLIYPSDYVYASTYASCRQDPFSNTCKNNNWLYNGVLYLTISPLSSNDHNVFSMHSVGGLYSNFALYRTNIRPSLYLKSDVKVVGGTGTSSDPYTFYQGGLTLTLELNGGSTTQTINDFYGSGEKVTLIEPTKEGYKFNGWKITSGDGTLDGNVLTINTESVVIEATWKKQVTLTALTNYIENQYNVNASSNGLEKDTTPDLNIRYVGANPKNYVKFNNELWRIIGIFNGNVKLVRDDILTTYSFDNKTTAQGIETDRGTNDWANSYLREFLNDYYYEGKTITCHSEASGAVGGATTATNATITCPDINKINESAKSMIQNTMWNLGCFGYGKKSVNELYTKEKGTEVYNGHATKSSDYIGLIYPSDYGFASTDESCSQAPLSRACKNNNWLFKGVHYWTISPVSSGAYNTFIVTSYGDLATGVVLGRASVRPSLYLKSDVKVVGGTGTSSDPYTLEI